jgi:hypothetical protein
LRARLFLRDYRDFSRKRFDILFHPALCIYLKRIRGSTTT